MDENVNFWGNGGFEVPIHKSKNELLNVICVNNESIVSQYGNNKSPQVSDWTEDQCIRNTEYQSDISVKVKSQFYHKRWANMNEETRLKRVEYETDCRASVIEKKRKKQAVYDSKWRSKLTEEERQRILENQRIKRANMTEEERMKKAEYHRLRGLNITEEERLKRAEKLRLWRANWSTEKRQKVAENNRVRRANMSKEGRIKKSEYNTKLRARKIKERRIRKAENYLIQCRNATEERIKNAELKPIQKPAKTDKRSSNRSKYDPLKNLIHKMIKCKMNVELIPQLDKNLFREILKLFGIHYPPEGFLIKRKSEILRLSYTIDICYLIELLRNWEGWTLSIGAKYSDDSYNSLFFYLQSNFLDFKLQRNQFLLEEFNNFFVMDNSISATCSFKQLQTLFFHNPQNHIKLYSQDICEEVCISSLNSQSKVLLSKYIIILPYISTQIVLPNFSITRQNNHLNEYKLLNITNEFNTTLVKNECTDFFVKEMADVNNTTKYLKHIIIKFLYQLKNVIYNKASDDDTIENISEIITALSVIEDDVSQCPSIIESNTKYNMNLTAYPYTRYLGCPDDGNIYKSMEDQKAIKKTILNVRLQQIRHPITTIVLKNFNVHCENKNNDVHFTFDERFLNGINTCITYECLLCNECLGSSSSSRLISEHFFKYHGLEPDWECTKCLRSFTDNYLIKECWRHDCK